MDVYLQRATREKVLDNRWWMNTDDLGLLYLNLVWIGKHLKL